MNIKILGLILLTVSSACSKHKGKEQAKALPYKPATTPARVSVATPGSLRLAHVSGLKLDDTASRDSVGYYYMSEALQNVSNDIRGSTVHIYEMDVAWPLIEAYCSQKAGAAWTTCDVTDGSIKITYTDSMYEGLVSVLGGEADLDAAELASLQEKKGMEYGIEPMTVSKLDPAANDDKFEKRAIFKEANGNSTSIDWNKHVISTNIHYSEIDSDGRKNSGDYSVYYSDIKNISVILGNYVEGDHQYKERISVGAKAGAEAKNGVWFTAKIAETSQTANYNIDIDGFADDDGGFSKAKEINDQVAFVSGVLSVPAIANQQYLLTQSDVTDNGKLSWDVSIGSLIGNGTTNPTGLEYWGPARNASTLAPTFKLWTVTLDADGNVASTPASSLSNTKFSSLQVKVTPEDNFFTEFFHPGGVISYLCKQETANGPCVIELGDKTEAGQSQYDDEAKTAQAIDTKIVLTGVSAADVTGSDLYIIPLVADLTTVKTTDDASLNDILVGYGRFSSTADSSVALPADLSGYEFSYWGATDPAATKVYYISYLTDGSSQFKLLNNAKVAKAP